MFYSLIKILVRQALKIFCCRITITNAGMTSELGPLLIVANHPNSFLDAIIIGSVFDNPVHFLARGDAFNKPWHSYLLRTLNMIPVYRLSEGKENLSLNEGAFKRSKEILSANGIVLIFIEGICVHKHELQPFKKGAGRIAWESRDLPGFNIIPIGIAYDSFEKFGKKINIQLGDPVPAKPLLPYETPGPSILNFNGVMYEEIGKRIIIPAAGVAKIKYSISFPGRLGYLLHLPLYTVLKNYIRNKTRGTVFFDSVLFGGLLFIYPLYLFILGIVLWLLGVSPLLVIAIVFIHPILARYSVKRKGNNN